MPERQQDLFMQFAAGRLTAGANSGTLVEEVISTGLSIRGGYAWLIHFVEVMFTRSDSADADNIRKVAFSVRQGEALLPEIDDAGTIARIDRAILYAASGVVQVPELMRYAMLPPVVIANPKVSVYYEDQTDDAPFRNLEIPFRIGYTTIPIDQKMYLEVAETWEVL